MSYHGVSLKRILMILALSAAVISPAYVGAEEKQAAVVEETKKQDVVSSEEKKTEEKKEKSEDGSKDEAAKANENPDGNVALINGKPVTKEDLQRELTGIRRRFQQSGKTITDEELEEIQSEVLDQLIGMRLLYEESVKKGFTVKDEQVEEQFASFRQQFPSDEAFNEMLKELKYDEGRLKDDLRKNIIVQDFIEKEIKAKTAVTEDETREYFEKSEYNFRQPEQVKAKHILVKIEEGADQGTRDAALKKIKEIQERVKKGDDFSALAVEYSDCPSKEHGGEIGFIIRGQMDEPFEKAAFALDAGQTSDIVESRFGYHIIKVEQKKPEIKASYEEMKEKIRYILSTLKVRGNVQKYIEDLKEKAEIKKFLPLS